ncbi:MAG: hypothetical protein ACLR8Y_11425 [Alistipes indistinctus]
MERYGLERDGYFTVVVSAGQRGGKYYCQDEADYLDCYRDIIGSLAQKEALADKKIVLLAHTFGRYGDETEYVPEIIRPVTGGVEKSGRCRSRIRFSKPGRGSCSETVFLP